MITNYINIRKINYIIFCFLLLFLNIFTLLIWFILLPFNKKIRNEIVYRTHMLITTILYKLFFTIRIINKVHYKNIFFKERYIICPNHQTIDIYLYTLNILNNNFKYITTILDKILLYRVPILSWIWYLLDYKFVDPKKSNITNITIKQLNENNHLSLIIFPEGKLSEDLKFKEERVKTGAFQIALNTGLPILPIYHNLGLGLEHTNKPLALNYGASMKIYIGDPIYPDGKSVEQLKQEYIAQMKSIEEKYFS